MKQTFEGYVKARIKEESGMNTLSIKRLCALAVKDKPQLAPLLFLYAAYENKLYHFMSFVWNTRIEHECRFAFNMLKEHKSLNDFLNSPDLPIPIKRITQDYLAKQNGKQEKYESLMRIRTRILAAMEFRDVNRYQLCKACKVNFGNGYAFLSGDMSKVSVETAQRMLDYIYAQPAPKR